MSRSEPIMQFFAYEHLPKHLADVSKPFCRLAEIVEGTLPRNAERSAALRKLLEAKDAAVRARLFKDVMPEEPQPTFGPGGVSYVSDPPGTSGGGGGT